MFFHIAVIFEFAIICIRVHPSTHRLVRNGHSASIGSTARRIGYSYKTKWNLSGYHKMQTKLWFHYSPTGYCDYRSNLRPVKTGVGDLGLVYPSVGVARVLGGGFVCTAESEAMNRWEEEIEEEKKTMKSWKGRRCVSMCVDKMRIKKGHCNAPSVAKKG